MIKAVVKSDGQPTEAIRDDAEYIVSGSCNKCGKCCELYIKEFGSTCPHFKNGECMIYDKKPACCNAYPANENFNAIPKECSYVFTKKGTKETVDFTREVKCQ